MKPYQMKEYLEDFNENIEKNVIKIQKDVAEKIWEELTVTAPMNTGEYISSIEISKPTTRRKKISTRVFSDLQVTTKSGKSYNLGFLLEHGTDMHAIPNAFGWGYFKGYIGKDGRWHKGTLDKDWHPGSIAQPHWQPTYNKYKLYYQKKLKEGIMK